MPNLTMKICSVVLLVVGFSYGQSSEEYFIKGRAYTLYGNAASACRMYQEAYQKDSTSVTLGEVYGRSLVGVGKANEGAAILRGAAEERIKVCSWSKAFSLYWDIFLVTGSYSDGNMLAFTMFWEGVENQDTLKIEKAEKVWKVLEIRAMKENKLDTAKVIVDLRKKANYEASSKSKNPPTLKIFQSDIGTSEPLV
jgi:hypothetical protein